MTIALISKETTLQVFDNIPTINGLGLEPVIALRDVKEIIKAVPEVDAVPLEPLCNFLAAYAAPPIRSPLATYGSLEEAWKAFLIDWMEEQQS